MKNWFLYIILLLICHQGQGQPASWSVKTTSFASTIIFNRNAAKLNGQVQPLAQGDGVAIFVRHQLDSNYYCAGYQYYANGMDSLTITTYLEDTLNPTPYKLRFYSFVQNCEVELADSLVTRLRYNGLIRRAAGVVPDVHYSSDTLYRSDRNALPLGGVPGIIYSFTGNGLSVDSLTGTINLNASKVGYYTIYLNYRFCLKSVLANVTIAERRIADTLPDISQLIFDKLPATCDKEGSIFIKTSSITGKQPFTYKLENKSDNSLLISTSGVFEEVKQGNYSLAIADSVGSTAFYPSIIYIDKVGDCQNTVLRPDGRDGIQSLYIPEAGQAKILNRNGEVIKQLSIPGEWNCQDNQGRQVPMGDYYLIINDTQSKVITVLR